MQNNQTTAVNAAVNAFNRELLAEHLRTCVARDLKDGHDEIVDELAATLQEGRDCPALSLYVVLERIFSARSGYLS